METSHPLSIESFSYSWLVNLKPSIESLEGSLRASLDASDEASFIEMDPRMPPSKRFFRNSQDFKFDFPTSQSPLTLVDADDLFSNGYLMPLFVESLKMEAYEASDSNPSLPSSSHVPKIVVPNAHSRCPSLKRCRTLSRRIFQKYLNFLRPLCRRLRSAKSGSKSESVIKRTESAKNRGCYSESSPRISVAYSADDWRKSCDSESSIYEAVLHCKRSIVFDTARNCRQMREDELRMLQKGCIWRLKSKEKREDKGKREMIKRLNHDQPLLCYNILCLNDFKMSIGNKDVVGQALFKH